MKLCPYCAEEIQDAAIKCKHCGEFLQKTAISEAPGNASEPELKWYFRKISLIIILGCIGPLGLPLIWWHPTLNKFWKIGLTLSILILTLLSISTTIMLLKVLSNSYNELQHMLNV